MEHNDKVVLIYSTCPSLAVAEQIGRALVERGQSACVNILPQIVSIYSWQGQLQRDEEVGMLVKTRRQMAEKVIASIEELHPYDVPAALIVRVDGGAREFLRWIGAQTGLRSTNSERR